MSSSCLLAGRNEVVIEEREQGIQEIHNQIGEINKIFKDLAVLILVLTLTTLELKLLKEDLSSHKPQTHTKIKTHLCVWNVFIDRKSINEYVT
ncbi:unnamed protein product [Brassica rapa]|uniref:t-SNARE coiled-coil homology domain-containing protein n=1 Tax=Brassica campestris TaxID=3711 RepID=A0A8D9CVM7_BRACM|nr:unnamed protein product [Brassica rapa]